MAFLQQEVGKGFVCVCLHQHLWISLCECLCSYETLRVFFSCLCVSFVSVFASMCVCSGEAEFYSHIYIHTPPLYSTLLPKHRPQLSLFPVHPQRSYSWQKTHQVGRTTDNWGDDRSCSKTIDSDGDRGSGELSRLTELSGGSGSARPECGITHSIDTAALVAKKKSSLSLFIFWGTEN